MYRTSLVVLALLTPMVARAQTFAMGITGKCILVMQPDVKKELKLTKAQEKAIDQAVQTFGKDGMGMQDFDVYYMMRGVDKKVVEMIDATQATRLNEIFLQKNGLLSLYVKDVGLALGLNEAKQSEARAFATGCYAEVMKHFQSTKGRIDKKKLEEMRKVAEDKIAALLSPEETEKWKAMLGKPFKFPKGF